MPQFIDLSHTIRPDMPRFSPAAPDPVIEPWMSHQEAKASGRYDGCTCEVSRVEFLTSLGTYLDSPYHFHPEKESIEALDLSRLILPGVVADCTGFEPDSPIGPEMLPQGDIAGKAVLFNTGWSEYWGEELYMRHPFLTRECACALLDRGVGLAGIDVMIIDSTKDPARPVHHLLLGRGVLIAENLTNLAALDGLDFVFHAAPPKVERAAAFPVRAYAVTR